MNDARALSAHLLDLLRREQAAMAEFLVALAAFDRQRGWVELGYTSLFYFLHRELKLSSGAAYHRKTAAELIQRFPEVVDPLRDGRLCLSSVCELAKVITPDNRADVLPRFFHASKQEAKAVAAEICPVAAAPARTVVTAIPMQSSAARVQTASFTEAAPSASAARSALCLTQSFHPGETDRTTRGDAPCVVAPASTPPRTTAVPLTADLRRLHVTVSKRFMEKLAKARDALSHSHPGANEETILEAGLDLIIERAAKRKGIVARPRTLSVPGTADDSDCENGPRFIPAAVRREVWTRDEGRCRWPTADGGICGSTHRVQFDHVVPVVRGGRSTSGNLRLLCSMHNDLAARQVLGDEVMDRFTRGPRPQDAEQMLVT